MTMTNCENFIEQISALVDAELSDEEKAAVLEHIEECRDCRAVYEAFCDISRCMPQVMVEPPAKLKDSIMENIRSEAKKSRKPRLSIYRFAGLAAVFALVVLAATSGRFSAPKSSDNQILDAQASNKENNEIFFMGAPSYSNSEDRNADYCKGSPTKAISDMRDLISCLESIPQEEYGKAVDGYDGDLYGVLVLEGEIPADLNDTDKLLENKSEVFLRLSREEIENILQNTDNSVLIMNDEDADKGIVIIKKDEE